MIGAVTLGGQLTLSKVKIYSLYDENYFELVGMNAFEKALMFWREFIQMEPGINAEKRIEIE
ncbi:hypothetical protein [Undibacterium umbellatum]|uniref:hypothetical protein n=1 Tax=Undibacterium umbellatum TaxID=2762300 RepID=UPI001C9B6C2C|nr:hypothetical protein [Undibacterium umbellatum]